MTTYTQCDKCGYQKIFVGDVKTGPCPTCKSESWNVSMGGPKPKWWKE